MKPTTVLILLPTLAALVSAGCPAACTQALHLSCHNQTQIANLCCFEYPGGQLLQTQFWDSNPASGPADHWTVHGLWPDYCDGTYPQYCDESRQYTNITQILESFGETALLAYMKRYWADYHGQEEGFWEHEWGKHGTCMNTLLPSCYTSYKPQEEVVDFFSRTVELFKTLDTYKFLSAHGIVPTTEKNYTRASIQRALHAPRGVSATIQCYDGALDEVWYTYNLRGNIANGVFEPTDPTGEATSCGEMVAYLPKNLTSKYPVSSVTSSAAPTATLDRKCRKSPYPLMM